MALVSLPPISQILERAKEEVKSSLSSTPSTHRVKSEQELKDYIRKTFNTSLPEKACCEGHTAPWAVFCDAFFARYPVIVVKGSRGLAGKTYFLGLLAITEACLLGSDVAILGGSGAQSKRVQKAIEKFWSAPNSPRHLVKGEPGVTKTVFQTGNEIEALTASQNSVRGPHPQRLRLDEVDEMELPIFNAAMGQTMAANGIAAQTLIASTHQYPQGTYTEILKMAEEKGWPFREWCYRESLEANGGWLAQSEVDRKRSEMTADMWRTEVELQEPNSEGLAIESAAVDAMFDRQLGESDGELGKVEEFEAPQKKGSYATGGDWGKSAHFTAVPTLRTDVSPKRFVAFYRNRKAAYHVMVPKFNDRVKRYGGSACHDAHGVGAVIDEMLTIEAEGYTQWQGASRIALFSEYISAIERGDIKSPRTQAWYKAHRYVTNDDLYGNGHPADEFVGCALAYRASRLDGGKGKRIITDVTIR